MEQFARLYPKLSERQPLPGFYVPGLYVLFAISTLITSTRTRVPTTLPILVALAASSPYFTTGTLTDDYSQALPILAIPLAFIDFFVLSPLQDEEVRYVGVSHAPRDKVKGVREDDCNTIWKKLKWAMRLAFTMRGIGWNWQVKGVPQHPDKHTDCFAFVVKSIFHAGLSWLYKIACLYLIGIATATKLHGNSTAVQYALEAVIGWCGASWAFHGLNCWYRCGAGLTVAVRLCEVWEWPPLFGPLSDAWSVRQMWSSVWHQFIRRTVQQPGVRLARVLRLEKGTLGSKYLQLYMAFTLSMTLHEWYNFNSVRRDIGEFRFFMAQPFVITLEDFMYWCWRRTGHLDGHHQPLARSVGYIWTFVWFSYCLPQFVHGLLDVGIMGVDVGGPRAMALGQEHLNTLMRT